MSIVEGLQDLLRNDAQLPTLPSVIFQLQQVLADEDAGGAEVAAVIERDPALTARLLRAANSVAFGGGREQLVSVLAAVQRLGLGQVRTVCLALSIVRAFENRRRRLDPQAFWWHCAAVGSASRYLWERLHGKRGVEDAYVAGLLHDVGILLLDQYFSEEFDSVCLGREDLDLPLWQQEEDAFGIDHGRVGGLLLGAWRLPATVVDAVSCHHRPREAPEAHVALARVVYAAEACCRALGLGLSLEGQADEPAAEALSALGFGADEVPRIMEELEGVAASATSVVG